MKVLITFIFSLFLALHTEGVNAQQISIEKPIIPDSVFIEEADTSFYEEDNRPKNKTSPYKAAQEQYFAQPIESQKVNKNSWEKAKEGIDYSDDAIEKKKKSTSNFAPNPIWAVIFEFLKWFFIIGAIVLLAYLILRFIGEGNIFGNRKRRIADPSVEIDLEHIEENLETAELDPLIKQAIANKNFALAIRLYYLAILKELHLKGDIAWQKDKTNRTYVGEMRQHRLFEPFRTLTTVFERVWYGSQNIDERSFSVLEPDFSSMLKSLR